GPSGLIVFERLSGDDQQYCLCDSGLCAGPGSSPVTIPAAQTPASFEWNGHNWYGPSDTSNPLGPPFPVGSYVLEVSARGTVGGAPFEVRNQFAIELTP
ncbi:MAG TPA: hypothetical protein VK034_09005, partial [Enhygromyxa sp.]|nr:hypothetical protein [Enhygromyxa sp.]